MTVLNIRNVNPQTARIFKSEAALRGMTLAQLLDVLLQTRPPKVYPPAGADGAALGVTP